MFSWVMVSPSVESMVFYCWRFVADYLNVFRPTLLYLLYKKVKVRKVFYIFKIVGKEKKVKVSNPETSVSIQFTQVV